MAFEMTEDLEKKGKVWRMIGSYGLAAGTTIAAWAADILLKNYFNESSPGLFIAAALVSAWYGGLGPGLVAVVLTVALNLIFYSHPYLSMAVGVHGFERLIIFALV